MSLWGNLKDHVEGLFSRVGEEMDTAEGPKGFGDLWVNNHDLIQSGMTAAVFFGLIFLARRLGGVVRILIAAGFVVCSLVIFSFSLVKGTPSVIEVVYGGEYNFGNVYADIVAGCLLLYTGGSLLRRT